MPGVILARGDASIGQAIRDIHLVLACMSPEDLVGQVQYLPFPPA
jgi:hypothetical protein